MWGVGSRCADLPNRWLKGEAINMSCVFSLLFCNQGRLSCNPHCFQCPSVQLLHILLLLCGWVISLPQRASGFPGGSAGKESACNVRDLGLIPGLGRSSGEGKGYPLQYCGLENSTDCLVHGVAKNWTRLNDLHSLRELQVGLGEGASFLWGDPAAPVSPVCNFTETALPNVLGLPELQGILCHSS